MPINLFDCLLIAVLVAGVVRGRKHGGSEELLRVLKWLTLVLGCALVYEPVGALVASAGFFDYFSAYVLAYLGAALLIFLLFSTLERRLSAKLVGSDTFGRAEYYLGMGSGLVRYGCILMMALALLNARAFTPEEVEARKEYQMEAFGSTVFPTLHSLQQAVFERSMSGPRIRSNLGFLLINPSEEEQVTPSQTKLAGETEKRLTQARPQGLTK